MKTTKIILSAILMMMAMCIQAQTIQVMKDGKVVKEYPASEVKSVEVKPYVDRTVYLDENCQQPISGLTVVSGKSDISGSSWSDYSTYAFKCPSNATLLNMKVPFKVYTKSLSEKLEVPSNGIAEYDESCKSWWVSGFENGTVIILALE